MWDRKIAQFGKQWLTHKNQTEHNTSEIKTIRQELKELTEIVRNINFQVKQDRLHAQSDRQKLVLQLENALLKLENRLLKNSIQSTSPSQGETCLDFVNIEQPIPKHH
jgi:hypothetical protein